MSSPVVSAGAGTMRAGALGLLLPWAGPLLADPAASASGAATAQVIAPLAVTREADLDFGTIAIAANAMGSVSIVPFDSRPRYEGSASGICAAACAAPHPARFVVRGEPLRSYRVIIPPRLAITAPGSSATVQIDGLLVGTQSNRNGGEGALSGQGFDRFEVGGTLHLPIGAAEAHYTAQVPVIVTYL